MVGLGKIFRKNRSKWLTSVRSFPLLENVTQRFGDSPRPIGGENQSSIVNTTTDLKFEIPNREITHRLQAYGYSCGSACISMLFDIDEGITMDELRTDHKGTCVYQVIAFLSRNGYGVKIISVNSCYTLENWRLENICKQFPIYIQGLFKKKFNKRGRWTERNHAVLMSDGMIYDPSEEIPFPFEAYNHVFDKFIIKKMLIIEQERPNYGKND